MCLLELILQNVEKNTKYANKWLKYLQYPMFLTSRYSTFDKVIVGMSYTIGYICLFAMFLLLFWRYAYNRTHKADQYLVGYCSLTSLP